MPYSSIPVTGTNMGGITVNTPYEDKDKAVSVDDFLQLMIAEMTNQNVFGDGGSSGGGNSAQYITQLAQITTMQQMEQLAYYSKTNYVMGLIGKNVTVATLGIGASVTKDTGPIEKVELSGKDYVVYVNGKGYSLSEIMSVNNPDVVDESLINDISKSQVIVTDRKDTSVRIRWEEPSDDETTLDKLTYTVYYSTDKDMDSVSSVKKNGTVAGEANQQHIYGMNIEDLEPDTTYFANVIVKTPNGKEYIYKKTTFTTKES